VKLQAPKGVRGVGWETLRIHWILCSFFAETSLQVDEENGGKNMQQNTT